MKRKIYQTLLDWKRKDHNKVFLIIDGARRVGKSWIVEDEQEPRHGRDRRAKPHASSSLLET